MCIAGLLELRRRPRRVAAAITARRAAIARDYRTDHLTRATLDLYAELLAPADAAEIP